MNKIYLTLLSAAICAFSASALPKGHFAKRSVLAEGTWIKVGVEATGIYEISYDQLREMGFKDPSKVAVYGRGGTVLDQTFVSMTGTVSNPDGMKAVPVYRGNDKIYFYGQGPQKVNFNSQRSNDLRGYYNRKSNNIYTTRGYYFLTDSMEGAEMKQMQKPSTSVLPQVDAALGYFYHEKDLEHNLSNTGQVYWGEAVGKPGAPTELTFPVTLPDAQAGGKGFMTLEFYKSKKCPGTLSYGMKEAETTVSFATSDATSSSYTPLQPVNGYVSVTGETGEVFVRSESTEVPSYSNIDFWVLTYPMNIPTLTSIQPGEPAQQRFAVPNRSMDRPFQFNIKDCSTFALLDVTTPADPKVVPVDVTKGQGVATVTPSTTYADMVIFDTDRPQMQVSSYETSYSPVANQNLHAYSETGAEMLIICTEEMRTYADQIADIHREKEGISVVVATAEECYNEFSAGIPDPMAYRTMVKMLYEAPTKLRSLLLLGNLYADMRGISVEKDPKAGLIAYQSPSVSIERGGYNINDFHGMMADYLDVAQLERAEINVGVGVLPVRFPEEGEIIVKKIRDFYDKTDFAYSLNRFIPVGGIGDSHAHDQQAVSLAYEVNNLEGRANIATPIVLDAYGHKEAYRKMFSDLEKGSSYYIYLGHGAEAYLGQTREFFNAPDVMKLRNTTLPVTCFAGCTLTNFDRGRRGLGESIVTGTPFGAIASVLASRESYSGQNLEFFRSFFRNLYREGNADNSAVLDRPRTLGEIVASTKTSSYYANEHAYQLLGDPELRIPVPNRRINVDAAELKAQPGEGVTVTGYVCDKDGNPDTSYNGELVARFMEPIQTLVSQDLVTKQQYKDANGNPITVTVVYGDSQVAMGAAEVVEGRFSVDLHVPANTAVFDGRIGRLHLGAFDPESRIGAGSMHPMTYTVDPAATETSESRDEQAPSVDRIEFDPKTISADIAVSDNLALDFSDGQLSRPISIWLDGKELNRAQAGMPRLTDGVRAYEMQVVLTDIDYGTHALKVSVRDAAGNSTEHETTFSYERPTGTVDLALTSAPDDDMASFAVDGLMGDATIHILNADGVEIWSGTVSGNTANWNLEDSEGNPVSPGHYKAYVRGADGGAGFSRSIDVPVL